MSLLLQNRLIQKNCLFTIGVFFLCLFAMNDINAQMIIWEESFETCGNTSNCSSTRYTSASDFYGGASDYWGRININEDFYLTDATNSNNIHVSTPYAGANGSFFYAGEDLDDTGPLEGTQDGNIFKTVTFATITISGGTNLEFRGLFARGETDGCTLSTYDDNDGVVVEYSVDGGGTMTGLCFEPDLECNIPGDINNEPLHHDPNCDGDGGEGTVLTNNFQEFTFNIAGTGNTLDLSITVTMDAGSEEFAFDYFRIYSDTPILSTELSSFKAQREEEQVLLEWTTASEINSEYFAVERSTDGHNFAAIGKVASAFQSNSAQNYQYIDLLPPKGSELYYRLRQVDTDGGFEYSKVVNVEGWKKENSFSLYPNPVEENTVVLQPMQMLEKATTLSIYNIFGTLVQEIQLAPDQSTYSIDLHSLPQGTYLLHLQGDHVQHSKFLVKQ